ncbi:hypothetical protein ACFWCB_09360 [Streptomyces sp. NPDC060048]|uniref:hypothetical protein n=1 Tax=unclassified Streptomyces TaxID=2593676 RepID=UPI0036BE2319
MALEDPHLASRDQPESVCATSAEAPLRGQADMLAGAEFLPCGRPLGRAWEQARTPVGMADPHIGHCPSCQEAIEGLRALALATRALRAEERPDSHSLANRIISAVRAEVELGTLLRLTDPEHDLRIAESAKILRRAADTVPGARTASCRLTPSNGNRAVHAVAISVAAKLDKPLRERAEAVRQAVLHAAEHILGLAVTTVDVEVDAVLEPSRVPSDERAELSEG